MRPAAEGSRAGRQPRGSVVLRGVGWGLPDGGAVLVDAGLTSIKRGRATIRDGRPAALALTPPVPPPLGPRAGALADFLAGAAAEAAGKPAKDGVQAPPVSSAGFAVATYTDATGQPVHGQAGLYGSLGAIPLARRLTAQLEARLGRAVTVRTRNDGEAAAMAMTGVADAVIVLGTAIGVGLNV